jgi:hypothetical protein
MLHLGNLQEIKKKKINVDNSSKVILRGFLRLITWHVKQLKVSDDCETLGSHSAVSEDI